MKAILAALLLVASVAYAKPVAEIRVPDGFIQLRSEACETAAIVALLKPDMVQHFRRADITWLGKRYAACWTEQPEYIFVVDETGDNGVIPKYAFKKPSTEI